MSTSAKPVAVVTGSSGFIGSRLVEHLVASGYQVRRLLRVHSKPRDAEARSFGVASGRQLSDVEDHVVDFDDRDTLRRSPALVGAALVFHLAGVTKALTADDFRRGNVTPTVNLLRALEGNRSLRRFVLVSSQAAAGPARSLGAPTTEDDSPRPIEGYGTSKLEAEEEARRMMPRVPITIVRPCSVYGPGDVDFLALFRMAQRRSVFLPGTASQYMSLLYVDDVVHALLDAAVADATTGETIFLSSRQPVTWRELAASLGVATGRTVVCVNVPSLFIRAAVPFGELWAHISGRASLLNRHKIALARPRYWICSADRAARLFGFAPKVDLPEGLRSTYSWYVHEGWLTAATPAAGQT